MNGRESKRLYKIAVAEGLTTPEFRRMKKTLQHENLHNRMPSNPVRMSKKMHKGESLLEFRKRRELSNSKRRLREQGQRQQKRKKCPNCGDTGPHFVPPTGFQGTRMHENGFFICKRKAA